MYSRRTLPCRSPLQCSAASAAGWAGEIGSGLRIRHQTRHLLLNRPPSSCRLPTHLAPSSTARAARETCAPRPPGKLARALDKVIEANAANPVVEGISGAVDSPIDLSGIKTSMQIPGYCKRYS